MPNGSFAILGQAALQQLGSLAVKSLPFINLAIQLADEFEMRQLEDELRKLRIQQGMSAQPARPRVDMEEMADFWENETAELEGHYLEYVQGERGRCCWCGQHECACG